MDELDEAAEGFERFQKKAGTTLAIMDGLLAQMSQQAEETLAAVQRQPDLVAKSWEVVATCEQVIESASEASEALGNALHAFKRLQGMALGE